MITKSEKEREDLSELINAAEEKESQFYKDLEEINKKTKANGVSSTLGGEERKAALKEEKLKLKNNKKIFEELRNANDYTKSLFKKDWSKQTELIRNQLEQKNVIQKKIDTLKSKKALLESLVKQRQEVISNTFLENNKVMIFKIIKKINLIYKEAAKTELNNYVSIFDNY